MAKMLPEGEYFHGIIGRVKITEDCLQKQQYNKNPFTIYIDMGDERPLEVSVNLLRTKDLVPISFF